MSESSRRRGAFPVFDPSSANAGPWNSQSPPILSLLHSPSVVESRNVETPALLSESHHGLVGLAARYGICAIYAAVVLFGRERPSFRIRPWRVVRLSPSFSAAPLGPPITQFVSLRVLRMWSYSASSSVIGRAGLSCSDGVIGGTGLSCSDQLRLSNGARSVVPGDRMTARSTKFCNSRTLPRQAYRLTAAIVSTGPVSTCRFMRREQSLTKAFTSKGLSSRLCRSGGTATGKTLRRK